MDLRGVEERRGDDMHGEEEVEEVARAYGGLVRVRARIGVKVRVGARARVGVGVRVRVG